VPSAPGSKPAGAAPIGTSLGTTPGPPRPGVIPAGLVRPGLESAGFIPAPGVVVSAPGAVSPDVPGIMPGFVIPGLARPGVVAPGVPKPGLASAGAPRPGLVSRHRRQVDPELRQSLRQRAHQLAGQVAHDCRLLEFVMLWRLAACSRFVNQEVCARTRDCQGGDRAHGCRKLASASVRHGSLLYLTMCCVGASHRFYLARITQSRWYEW
jgi:hypothetical protein